MQRMNMFKLYSDLYNVLLQVFVLLAIGRLIFHLRRLIILWTGFKKNKEATALKVKVNGIKLSNKFLQQKVDSLVTKLKAENDHRFKALKAKDAFNQEVTALKHQVKDLTSSNEVLMIKVENLVAKLDASDHKIVALQVNAALKQEKISQTESQCEEFKMQNSLWQEQIESLSKKQATSIQEADEARKSHEEDMKRLSFENEIYKSQISHSEKKIQQLSNTTQKEVEIKNNVIKYLRAANEKLAAAEEENSQNKSQCVDLERKNRLLQEEIESVSSKMVTSDQAAAEAGKVYEEDMKRLSTENELFCSQIKDTAQHIQTLTKTIQEQESMKNLLSNYLRAAYEKLVAAEEKISQIESKCEEFKTPNSLLQKQIESLCKKLTTSMQEADEARKSHEEDMKRLSNENELFKSQIENTAQHIQDLKNTIQEQESMKNDLKKYLKKKKKQKGGNERQLDQLRESSS